MNYINKHLNKTRKEQRRRKTEIHKKVGKCVTNQWFAEMIEVYRYQSRHVTIKFKHRLIFYFIWELKLLGNKNHNTIKSVQNNDNITS